MAVSFQCMTKFTTIKKKKKRVNQYTSENILKKIIEKRALWKSLYEASLILIPKPCKDTTLKRKLQANIIDKYRHKNSQQNISKLSPTMHLKDHAS